MCVYVFFMKNIKCSIPKRLCPQPGKKYFIFKPHTMLLQYVLGSYTQYLRQKK